ncbi:MAG: ribosome small subunit-dependent GTPase A, partial [Bacteroidales bacterium]|nr:ribosome small subunit-dependent GTPase A [Bacteroidales bacterium]
MKKGQVIQSTGSKYLVELENKIFECSIKGRLRLENSRETNPVAVGDFVEFELISDTEGVISKLEERKNCIVRKSTNLSKESHIIAANIDQAVFIHTLKSPETTTVFMDRFLAAAESYSIPPLIIFNKIDIYNKVEIEEVAMLMAIYEDIGYKVIASSLLKNQNIELIKEALKNKVNVIAGHSGTGKSSLINAVEPGLNLKTATISKTHFTGRHT